MQTPVIELMGFFHLFHETWEFLKLRPLIIGGPHRHIDVNGCCNGRYMLLMFSGYSRSMINRIHLLSIHERGGERCDFVDRSISDGMEGQES